MDLFRQPTTVGIVFITCLLALLGAFSIGYVVFTHRANETASFATTSLRIGTTTLSVEIADTGALREQGLSGRSGLSDGTGMLFVFPFRNRYSFWMKDMLFPIDIIWIDENKQVIHVEKNLSPSTYPQSYASVSDAQYVLEVPAGFFDAHKMKFGDFINF